MPTVYIETTIPSYYFETRADPEIQTWRNATRRWWAQTAPRYELVTSDFVLEELRGAPPAKATACLELLAGVRVLEEAPGTIETAAHYIEHRLMPAEARGDAAHVAMASVHGIDFLLTWNCRHLANANKVKHLTVLNARLGLPIPVIATPLTLLSE